MENDINMMVISVEDSSQQNRKCQGSILLNANTCSLHWFPYT